MWNLALNMQKLKKPFSFNVQVTFVLTEIQQKIISFLTEQLLYGIIGRESKKYLIQFKIHNNATNALIFIRVLVAIYIENHSQISIVLPIK